MTTVEVPRRVDTLPTRIDRLSPVHATVLVFSVLLALYLPSATYDLRINTDTAMAAMPAWNLVEHGTLDLRQHADFLAVHDLAMHESREVGGSIYSGRNLGPIVWAIPFYAVASPWVGDEPLPVGPAAVAASVAAALAMAVLHLALRTAVTPTTAVAASLVMGTATTTWSVSADALWTHGPTQLAIALGILGMARQRHLLTGLAFGLGILCRPDLAFAAAAAGLTLGALTRTPSTVVRVGVGATLGLAAVVAYGRLVFQQWSLIGGYYVYGEMFGDFATGGDGGLGGTLASYGSRFVRSWLDLDQGLLVYTPSLALLLPGLRKGWGSAPAWVRASAIAGLAHYGAQLVANGWWGGDFFFGYRYPLEPLTLAAPLFVHAYRDHVRADAGRRRAFLVLVAVGILWIGYGAIVEPYKG